MHGGRANPKYDNETVKAYQIPASTYSPPTSISFPCSSLALMRSNVDRIEATTRKRALLAKCLPGQILDEMKSKSLGIITALFVT